ncbi:methylthioribose-1-phosphate isomerase [Nitratiruptor sp. YY09-18]|nr:methylthioribose-1-phosphate isomerase [Nitratiruptor sp. YY09-18]
MLKTHLKIDRELCGEIVELKPGYAKVVQKTSPKMAADEEGLVHGGFTFGAADFVAMVAVNEPNVVLIAAEVKFKAPVKVGDEVVYEAKVLESEYPKAQVEVRAFVGEVEVMQGVFKTYVTLKHVFAVR